MKTLDNYSNKLSLKKETMKFIIDNANYFDDDEEILSFVVQELTAASHQINEFSPRCTVCML